MMRTESVHGIASGAEGLGLRQPAAAFWRQPAAANGATSPKQPQKKHPHRFLPALAPEGVVAS
jgi:hypothetical protein